MWQKAEKKVYEYQSWQDDFVESKRQDYSLKKDYQWIKDGFFYQVASAILYGIAYGIGFLYCKCVLHVKMKNREILKKYRGMGYFLYGNHTQPIGDVFIPALACQTKRIYTVVSQANLGVAGIGRFLPMLGALPISNSLQGTKKLWNAVKQRIEEKKCVVIYPEAHVWPYYTKIRPFSSTSFKFPVACGVPSFTITTTYYKRRWWKKPGILVYVDGPFFPKEGATKKEQEELLAKEVYQCMQKRSEESSYEYVIYQEKDISKIEEE